MKKEKKANIILIVVIVLIIALVAVIIIGNHHKKTNNLTTTTVNSSTTQKTTQSVKSDDQYPISGDELNIPDKGLYTGVGKAVIKSISSKPQLYYFNNGKFDKTFTGLADSLELKDGIPTHEYYVKNGVVQTNFTGVVSFMHYMRVIKNGVYQENYNGKVSMGGLEADCQNGAVLSIELGRDDGFIPPYKVTIMD